MIYIVNHIKRFLLIAIMSFFAFACKEKKEVEIVILSTNDIHAKIDNFPKVMAYVEQQRKQNPNLLVLNAGDMFSGNPVVDQYSDKGFPIIDIMNRVGYSYTTFGNHEFDYDRELLKARIDQANFKFLCANMKVSPEGIIPQPQPYEITTVDGVKIAILGLIEVSPGSTIPSTHPDKVKGITFSDPIKTAQEYAYLKDKSDVLIALTHIAASVDVKLAEAMPELDVIVGGHSHTRIDSAMLVNNVLITQADSWLKYIGKTTIRVKDGKVTYRHNELIPVKSLTESNQDIEKLVSDYNRSSGFDTVVAQNLTAINGKEPLGCLMTDAITELLGVDIAFQNSGGVRMSSFPKGGITKAQIYELDPFGNEIILYQMTPAEIRELLYNSNPRGYAADLFVSGITYAMSKKGGADKVILKTYDGKTLDEGKVYKVAMNSYIASSYKFTGSEKGKSVYKTSAEVLIDYLTKKKEVSYANTTRTSVVD